MFFPDKCKNCNKILKIDYEENSFKNKEFKYIYLHCVNKKCKNQTYISLEEDTIYQTFNFGAIFIEVGVNNGNYYTSFEYKGRQINQFNNCIDTSIEHINKCVSKIKLLNNL